MTTADNISQRPRVLLLAYACSPGQGSEPGVGWNRAVQTATFCDTWVICEGRQSAQAIRSHLETSGPIDGLKFEFVPLTPWELLLGRIPGAGYLAYRSWHRRAFRVARRLHRRVCFDLVHQVNLCGFREPGLLWKLDVPFVWGPVGGTQNYPWRFLARAGLPGAMTEALRSAINVLQLRYSPRVRRASNKAAALLAANSTNQRDFARAGHVESILLLETGLQQVASAPNERPADRKELRILWSGQFQPWKALPLLIEALARLPGEIPYELRILGKGPLESRLRRLARRTGVEAHTTWRGWLPHAEALAEYTWADLFVFTSLRDTSGNAVLEALGAGVPVVCLDHQGVRDMVTDACGIKIPVTTPAEVIDRLSLAIARMAQDTAAWHRFSRHALERGRDYLWSRQTEQIRRVYRRVLKRRLSETPSPERVLV